MTKLDATLEQFEKALDRLGEALAFEKTPITRDSAILRFEIAMNLSWKMLKSFLELKRGVMCSSPKGCFKEAFRQKLIPYDEAWLDYIDLRNETAHTYNETFAESLYSQLDEVLGKRRSLLLAVQSAEE